MSEITQRSGGRKYAGSAVKSLFILLVATVIFALAPPYAAAQAPTGAPVATMPLGKSGSGLRAPGVKAVTSGRAKQFKSEVGFPVTDISVGTKGRASMVLSGGFTIKRGKRSVAIRGMLVRIAGRDVTITAKLGGRRAEVFTGRSKRQPALDGSRQSIVLSVSKLSLTASAERRIAKLLRRFNPRSRTLGRLSASAYVIAPSGDGGATTDPSAAHSCQPVSGPSSDPSKPLSAVDVTCASIVWNMRDSWIDYIDQSVAVAPAAALPAIAGKDHLCPDGGATRVASYSFNLPPVSGWWDPVSGSGELSSSGGERSTGLRADTHIDIQLSDIEVRLNGAASELWATVWLRNSDAPETSQRVRFATLDASQPITGPAPAPGVALSRLRAKLTDAGADAFRQYSSGSGFGCLDIGLNF